MSFLGGFDDNCSLETCERYSPKTEKWESVAKLSCPRGGVGLAALGGRLYAVGGHDGRNYLNSVEAYDPLTDRWVLIIMIEPHREKTCLWGFQPGATQTGLYGHRRWQEA